MAKITIDQLPIAIGLDGTEWVPIAKNTGAGYETEKTTIGSIAEGGMDASFVLATQDFSFPSSRVLAPQPGETTLADGGAGANLTIGLANTTVAPGVYGDATHVSQIAIDAKGRITSASSVPISPQGDVIGPGSSTAGHVALFADNTGKLLEDGGQLGNAAYRSYSDFVFRIPTFAGAPTADIPLSVTQVYIEDVSSLYNRVASEPSDTLKFNNNGWWALSGFERNFYQANAVLGGNVTAAFQALLGELDSVNGGEITIPRGTFYLDPDTITLPPLLGTSGLVKLSGQGAASQLLASKAGNALITIQSGKVLFENFLMDGQHLVSKTVLNNPTGQADYNTLLSQMNLRGSAYNFYNDNDGQNWTLDNCYLFDASNSGVYSANDSRNSVISNTLIENLSTGGDGFTFVKNTQQPEGVTIVSTRTLTPGGRAYDIQTGLALRVLGCVFDQNIRSSRIGSSTNSISGVDFIGCWWGGTSTGRVDSFAVEVFGLIQTLNIMGGQIHTYDNSLYIHGAGVQNVNVYGTEIRPGGTTLANYGISVDSSTIVNVLGVMFNPSSTASSNVIEVNNPKTYYGGATRFTTATQNTFGTNAAFGDCYGLTIGVASFSHISTLTNGTVGAPPYTFVSDKTTGMYLQSPGVLAFAAGGVQWARGNSGGSAILGLSGLTTTSTDGFVYTPAVSGPPTGVPVAQGARVPKVMDTLNSKEWAYINGVWKSSTFT